MKPIITFLDRIGPHLHQSGIRRMPQAPTVRADLVYENMGKVHEHPDVLMNERWWQIALKRKHTAESQMEIVKAAMEAGLELRPLGVAFSLLSSTQKPYHVYISLSSLMPDVAQKAAQCMERPKTEQP